MARSLGRAAGLAALSICSLIGSSSTRAAILSLPEDAGAPPGLTTNVPLFIDDATGLIGADIRITYDPTVTTATAVAKTPLSDSHILTINLGDPGVIRISLFGAIPLSGGGDLLDITFQSVGILESTTALHFDSVALNEGSIPASPQDGSYCVQGSVFEIQGVLAGPLTAGSSAVVFSWSPDPFADSYRIYRAGEPDLSDLTCILTDLVVTSATIDDVNPPAGRASFYLTTGVNCRGEGGAGSASDGAARPSLPACF